MKIGILRHKKRNYAVSRILEEANKIAEGTIIDPKKLTLFINHHYSVDIGLREVRDIDVLIPRFDTEIYRYELIVLDHFERMGMPMVNSARTIEICQNKYETCLALKKANVPQPNCAISYSSQEMFKHIRHMAKPLVFKDLYGTFGKGVVLIKSDQEAQDILEAMQVFHRPLYIQEYIPHKLEDFRIFVIGDKVIACMRRVANRGQWKTNISLGNKGYVHTPSEEMKRIAIRSSKAVGADISGVDIIQREDGVLQVIEVNQCPDFKGLEKATGKNIAREIVKFAIRKAKLKS